MRQSSLSFFEALAVLVGTVIGAGVLGIPYAVAKVGWLVGVVYLVCLGILVMGLHLLLGEIVVRTKQPLQIPGLAAKYLGKSGKSWVTFATLFGSYGALLAYLIGEGKVLQALFGGDAFWWTLLFWLVGSWLVFFGLRVIRKMDLILTLAIFVLVFIITFWSAPVVHWPNLFGEVNWANLFLPYGVILFALQGASAIPQVEDILPGDQKRLRQAILVGGLIPIVVYFLFMTAIVGVTGSATTEVATIGLGGKIGSAAIIIGNLFAFFTMGTCFLNAAIANKRLFEWDYKVDRFNAWLLTVLAPLLLFLLGARSFIGTIEIVGTIFGSLNAIILILIYWQARQKGDLPARRYKIHHALLLSILILLVFVVGAVLTFWENVR